MIPSRLAGFVSALALGLLGPRPAPTGGFPVAFISDIEGSIGKLSRFVALHEAFETGPDGLRHLKPGASFVCGGDVVDRFPGERRVLRELLRLKREAPDRVTLIAGNRDITKIRLLAELSDRAMRDGPPGTAPTGATGWSTGS